MTVICDGQPAICETECQCDHGGDEHLRTIEKIRSEREELSRVLKRHVGIIRILSELYPDSAHYIYELLQNAEDARATKAHFALRPNGLVFEHDGRPFEERDIERITDIGAGTEARNGDTIGRFGVGFKSVLEYTTTPYVWSPTFSFKIADLVLPWPLGKVPFLTNKTRIDLPFDKPNKPAEDAFKETAAKLNDLAELTLLFLTHITSITWHIDGTDLCKVDRCEHFKQHVEIRKWSGPKLEATYHFLKVDEQVQLKGTEHLRVAVAYTLNLLPNVDTFNVNEPLSKQLKIVPATPGRVSVFFPAEKENPGFRFHMHAPFVPDVARASIKETPANTPLFEQLGRLVAQSLRQIRELGLLTTEFLEVLPNQDDEIWNRYAVIPETIINAMNEQPLTPTLSKSHAPAKQLLRGKAPLKSLLGVDDLRFLVPSDHSRWRWAVGAPQHSRADRLLNSLALTVWDVDDFVTILCNTTISNRRTGLPEYISYEAMQAWLLSKPVEWFQECYALMYNEYIAGVVPRRNDSSAKLKQLYIVLLYNGTLGVGQTCYFPADTTDTTELEELAFVDPRLYSVGKNKERKESARKFLEAIGVQEVSELSIIEGRLQSRYTPDAQPPSWRAYITDLDRFLAASERDANLIGTFKEYHICCCADGTWRVPEKVFLDKPFSDSGLSAFYGEPPLSSERYALHERYQNLSNELIRRIAAFALSAGAVKSIEILKIDDCGNNPNRGWLVDNAPGRVGGGYIEEDYTIPGLDRILGNPTIQISRLVWTSLQAQADISWTTARVRKSRDCEERTSPSQLACLLKEAAWIPQGDERFVRPRDASRELLPDGFSVDSGWKWLERIDFGKRPVPGDEEDKNSWEIAKGVLGCPDDASFDRVKRFAELGPEEQVRILADHKGGDEPPEKTPSDPERRREKVGQEAEDAPGREEEARTRSVSINRDLVKRDAREYLRDQYTNNDKQMFCQVCWKRLPFQLADGSYYFEAVECVSDLQRHHRPNYLALCPLHAAMYQHVNGSQNVMKVLMRECQLEEPWVRIVLANTEATIRFTEAHLLDLQAVMNSAGEC